LTTHAGHAQTTTPPSVKLFALVLTTGPAWQPDKPPNEQRFFREHSQHLFALRKEGKIEAGGRFGPYGLILLKAATLDEARAMLALDPSIENHVFKAELYPWSTIFDGTIQR
jgi:hypothetical protein